MQNQSEFKQHVINQLTRYINDTRDTVNEYDESVRDLVLEDITYAEIVLEKYKQSGDWNELREDLIAQDTLAREECFYYLVEGDQSTANTVGLTWQFAARGTQNV